MLFLKPIENQQEPNREDCIALRFWKELWLLAVTVVKESAGINKPYRRHMVCSYLRREGAGEEG